MQGPRRTAIALLVAVATVTAAMPVADIEADHPADHADAGDSPLRSGVDRSTGRDSLRAGPGAVAASPDRASTALVPVVQESNTTSRLVLPDDELRTVRFGTVRLDVGGSMAVDNAQLHGRYDAERLEQSFAAADSPAAQRAAVNRSADRLDARVATLVEREREALRDYNAGRLSTEGYLRELATIDAAARSMESTLGELHKYDRVAGMPVPATRIARMKAQLVPLTGPVRTATADAMTGSDGGSLRVYVETSTSGVVLSMVDRDQFATRYVREAYHGDSFDRQWADNPITHNEFEDRFAELYPWVWSANSQLNTVLTGEPYYFRAGVYSMAVNHPQGTDSNRDLLVYYDAGTESIFHEVQRLDPATVPTERVANGTDEGLHVELRAPYVGGPMTVRVTDAATGEPVDAAVTMDGERLGTTGDDRLWTVVPRGNFAVTASEGGRNVTASVTNSSINVANS